MLSLPLSLSSSSIRRDPFEVKRQPLGDNTSIVNVLSKPVVASNVSRPAGCNAGAVVTKGTLTTDRGDEKSVVPAKAKSKAKSIKDNEFVSGLDEIFDKVLEPQNSRFTRVQLYNIHNVSLNYLVVKSIKYKEDLKTTVDGHLGEIYCDGKKHEEYNTFGLPPAYMFFKKYQGKISVSTCMILGKKSGLPKVPEVSGGVKIHREVFEYTAELPIEELTLENFKNLNLTSGNPRGRVISGLTLKNFKNIKLLTNEADILKRLTHNPFVSHFLNSSFVTKGPNQRAVMFTELCNGGEVDVFLEKQNDKRRDALLPMVCLGLLRGIKALHKDKLIHGDIKTRNILIKHSGSTPETMRIEVKFIDFGSARFSDKEVQQPGTRLLFSPERRGAVDPDASSSFSDDIWMLGSAIFEIMVPGKAYPLLTLRDFHDKLDSFRESIIEIPEEKNSGFNPRVEYFDELTAGIVDLNLADLADFTDEEAYDVLTTISPRDYIKQMENERDGGILPCEDTMEGMRKTIKAYKQKEKDLRSATAAWIEANKGKEPLEGMNRESLYRELLMDMMHPDHTKRLTAEELVKKYSAPLERIAFRTAMANL